MDLYHIPGDTGYPWRLQKFVEYQHEVPSIHYRVLGEYIKKFIPDLDDAVMMCWYMSCTYNEVTCIFLQEVFDWRKLTPRTVTEYCQEFWDTHKPVLEFGSSRKYAKNMDWFPQLMGDFIRLTKRKPFKWLMQQQGASPIASYRNLVSAVMNIPHVGRFAADLFLESVMYLQELFGISYKEPSKLDWKRCSNLTSGLLNIMYLDQEANEFDKTGKLPVSEEDLRKELKTVKQAIQASYPEQDNEINLFIGKICSFRNLFKGTRYGGFHHDRELGWIRLYQQRFPEYDHLWKRLYKLRRIMFPKRFLGELNGWDGIRPQRKKLWLKEGLTGVEA